jgi:hypothetical protein
VPLEISQLMIRDMSLANPLWGAPRIHGELLKLGSLGTPVTPISATARITAFAAFGLNRSKTAGSLPFLLRISHSSSKSAQPTAHST